MRALRWLRGQPTALRSQTWLNWVRSTFLLFAACVAAVITRHAWFGLMEASLALRAPEGIHCVQVALGLLTLGLLGAWLSRRRVGTGWQRLSDTRLKAAIARIVRAHSVRVARMHRAVDIVLAAAVVVTGSALLGARNATVVEWFAALAGLLLVSGVCRYVSERYSAAHMFTPLNRSAPRVRRKRRA